ncbi:RNA polymerase sigma factor [Bacillus phage AaronPhadgers]|uniref:RNA polymerase sigma factor n=1 Tax=Bacillus phage Belinda TaxID=1852564 RepID=UPI0007A77210|nr:RNA polymerase sigma factor [Bacillus phage Belinda]YP_009291759.1 RNA polymerase sigma factor [Bacillus phage Zuko]ASR78965.1 RNA polymerase sigma factor [Bacillus phage AaronPhadgers]AXF41907.1 RNA polymerase sigma factor [Bacillus phage Saddex]QLF85911.1 RNA polymerase sigma factor [Bacillus phage Tomato]AMW62538.1 sigma factor [Bacillus phage Zuko]ANM46110.1 RNA polymerase sigma factor sigma-28 [Bacillus phage Belinda]
MSRDLEKEANKILNGAGFLKNVEETNGVFSRDPEQLFHQYKNLRVSVYNKYKGYIPDEATRAELMSYISEQFLRLVKEYDINGPVDFPFYVDNKLKLRVKNSFIKNNYRDKSRVFTTKHDFDVTDLIEMNESMDSLLEEMEVLEAALYGVKLDEIDRDILTLLVRENTDSYIIKILVAKYARDGAVPALLIEEKLADLKELLRTRLHEMIRERNL